MSKPTPAPWRVEGRCVMALKAKTVCECPSGGVVHGAVDEANTRLIAASPDLLAACEALIRYFDPTPDESRPTLAEIVDMASDAILKATRGQS